MKAHNLKLALARAATWITWELVPRKPDIDNRIPVLCYHRVLPDYIETSDPIYTILPEQFESQMAFLANKGFNSLSLQEFAGIVRGSRPLIDRSVLLTFDDGYTDTYAIAWPIAKKYHIKINIFICTGYIGLAQPIFMREDGYLVVKNSALGSEEHTGWQSHLRKFPQLWRPLTWGELREMKEAGVQIGFHSHSHRNLALLTPGEMVNDIATGVSIWERELGDRPKFFALPYGWYDSYTPEVIAILKNFGLELIFTAHLGRFHRFGDQPVCPRISIYQEDNLEVFQRKLLGAYDWLGQIQRGEHMMREFFRKMKSK